MDSHFDTEKFIIEVENRPAIWNSGCSEYSNRDIKKKCWEELTNIFSSENETMHEKKEIGINLQRKWKSLRDCFSRELSRIKKLKSGSETSRKNPYVYYNQLLFLKPIIQNKPTETNIIPDADESEDDLGGPSTSQALNSEPCSKKKNASINSLEKEIIDALHKSVELREEQTKKYEEDADRLFLLSLLKPLKQIPEPMRFSVKMNLMQIINNAQINSKSASLTISHPQQYNFGSQNVMSYINQDLNSGPRSMYLPNQLYSDPNYQKALQNQYNAQIKPTSVTQPYSSSTTPLPSPNNYTSTDNSSDSYIQTDIFNDNQL